MSYDPRLAIADRHLSASELAEKYTTEKDNGEHPQFTIDEWKNAVALKETSYRNSYWRWVEARLEEEAL